MLSSTILTGHSYKLKISIILKLSSSMLGSSIFISIITKMILGNSPLLWGERFRIWWWGRVSSFCRVLKSFPIRQSSTWILWGSTNTEWFQVSLSSRTENSTTFEISSPKSVSILSLPAIGSMSPTESQWISINRLSIPTTIIYLGWWIRMK